jgi:hypothetical protein
MVDGLLQLLGMEKIEWCERLRTKNQGHWGGFSPGPWSRLSSNPPRKLSTLQ